MDLFGIKKRRAEREAEAKAKRDAMLAARKTAIDVRSHVIDGWLKHVNTIQREEAEQRRANDLKEVEKANSTCPICHSKNRIHKFVRLKGEIDGSMSGGSSGYSSLFGGSSHSSVSGKLHGEMDTLQVNHCKDCGNQWEIAKPRHSFTCDYIDNPYATDYHGHVGFLYRRAMAVIEEDKWVPESTILYGFLSDFRKVPRMVLEYLVWTWYNGFDGPSLYDEDERENYKILNTPVIVNENKEDYNDEGYLFQFSEEDWDLMKKILKRDEYENWEYPNKK